MNERVQSVGLSKLFLWSEAERCHTVPAALAKAIPGREYTKREIAEELFGLRFDDRDTSRPMRGSVLRNCFGWERLAEDKVAIMGYNAFGQLEDGRFAVTPEAATVGRGYRDDDEEAWAGGMAQLLAKFEVRTRLVLHLLGKGGWRFRFPTSGFFGNPNSRAVLVREDEAVAPFDLSFPAFNRLLADHREIALGHWWRDALAQAGVEVADEFSFVGLRSAVPSVDKLGSRLKCSMFLFRYVGVIEYQGGGWKLSAERARAVLGEEIADDFVSSTGESKPSALAVLRHFAENLQDVEGYVVVSVLAEAWATAQGLDCNDACLAFDDFLRSELYEGRVRLVARHQGQPRHGRGLFGDDGARTIKLEF